MHHWTKLGNSESRAVPETCSFFWQENLILDGTTPFLYAFHLIHPVHPLINHCEQIHLPHGSSMMGSHHHLWLWDFIPGRTPSGAWSIPENHCPKPIKLGGYMRNFGDLSEYYEYIYMYIYIYIHMYILCYSPIMHKYNHYMDTNKSVISDFHQNFGETSKGPSKGTAPRLRDWFFALTGATSWHRPQNIGIYIVPFIYIYIIYIYIPIFIYQTATIYI